MAFLGHLGGIPESVQSATLPYRGKIELSEVLKEVLWKGSEPGVEFLLPSRWI